MKIKPNRLQATGIYVLLVLSILLVIVSAYITHYNTVEKEESTQTVIRRYRSIESATKLLSLIHDMESAQRGYILSGDSVFLTPYRQAQDGISTETSTLKKLINDNEEQTRFLEGEILQGIQRRSQDLDNGIRIFNAHGKDSAAHRLNIKTGQTHMDSLRVLVEDLVRRERLLLARQNETLEKNMSMEDSVRFFAFSLIGLTSLVALVALIERQRNIKNLVETLNRANEALEEKVQERTKQLVEANAAKDHFLGIASHDLKAPLSGILRLIELMKLEESGRVEKDREYLNYMEDACHDMLRLILNLLDINRIERGATPIAKQPVEVGKLMAKLENEFSHQARLKHIDFKAEIMPGLLYTDADALSRILENLLSNAIKFSPRHRVVQLHVEKNNDGFRFTVTDEGPGIPEEDIPYLFGKFQKLSNKPTGGEGSTGLGLSIAKELTHLLGGEITVHSELAKGTVFVVTIPES
jgi:signal transduction histidine kinase